MDPSATKVFVTGFMLDSTLNPFFTISCIHLSFGLVDWTYGVSQSTAPYFAGTSLTYQVTTTSLHYVWVCATDLSSLSMLYRIQVDPVNTFAYLGGDEV
jgi:hypothetical protein